VPLRLPQDRDVEKLRQLLRLVADGQTEPKEIGIRMGAGPNHPTTRAACLGSPSWTLLRETPSRTRSAEDPSSPTDPRAEREPLNATSRELAVDIHAGSSEGAHRCARGVQLLLNSSTHAAVVRAAAA
jgi:hypothetical protein